MQHDGARLVVENPNKVLRLAAPVASPLNVTGEHGFRTLQPLETDYGSGGGFRVAGGDGCLREDVDLFTRRRRLRGLGASFLGDAEPWIGHFGIEHVGIEAVSDIPGTSAGCDEFFTLPWAPPARTRGDLLVDFVRRPRRDCSDPAIADPIAAKNARETAKSVHREFARSVVKQLSDGVYA
jgi:hypothetical protein